MRWFRNSSPVGPIAIVFCVSFMVFAPLIYFATKSANEIENICTKHSMEMIGGGHAPLLCVDTRTGAVYHWRYLK